MDKAKFDAINGAAVPARYLLRQDMSEWRAFLEFCASYFRSRGIERPVVVEIGVMFNAQKNYYTDLLGAEHIGVDCNPNAAPDVLGHSQDALTVAAVKERLGGRPIDLLFIDAAHDYVNALADWETWDPLARHLVVFHDISATVNSGVSKLWGELAQQEGAMTVEFKRQNTTAAPEDNRYKDMGIGVLVKG